MELIIKLDIRLNKTGNNKQRWGLFLCPYCLQEVERTLNHGYKQKSCGCVHYKLISESQKGREFSKEHRQNISDSMKGNTPWNKGKKDIYSEEIIQKMRESQIKNGKNKGENNYFYGKSFIGKDNPNYGNGDKIRGSKNPNWQNGKSFEEYGIEFNKELKQQVLERDNYTCQCPNCTSLNETDLHIHHIDYDKTNNNLENLITLCNSCHSKTNPKTKRQYFTEFYQNVMINRIMECFL